MVHGGRGYGSEWEGITSGTSKDLNSVKYLEGNYFAVGDNSSILKSQDGITWETLNVYLDSKNVNEYNKGSIKHYIKHHDHH